jgi:hypothetical protein
MIIGDISKPKSRRGGGREEIFIHYGKQAAAASDVRVGGTIQKSYADYITHCDTAICA